MAKTSRDARRHMREWSDFFSDFDEVGALVIEEFIERHRRKKYLRQSLERLISRGFLQANKGKFAPTLRGKKLFRRYHQVEPVFNEKGKWYILSFDIPVKFNSKRVAFTRLLRAYNFIPFQKSVWLGSHGVAVDVWEWIVEQKIEKYCAPMVVDIIEGTEELKKRFGVNK
ncbi:MAG: hypothetical protein QMD65_02515 [Patescibacteria group bacterium]|nr:hypothetical protein [Patescibacteria group bacterium]